MNYYFWKNSRVQTIVFFAIFILLCLLYQYPTILFLRPESIHQWRQAVCLSIELNYYQHGMHFFMPEVHHLISDGGKSGQSAAEFPIIYYFNAFLWKIFGVKEFIPRLVNILICLLGSFYLFKLLGKILSPTWAIMIPLLVFTSPVIAFYANNFLIDIPVLFICFITVYYFFRYYEDGKTKDICIFMLFSLLVMVLKVTGGIFFFATICLLLFERLKIINFNKKIFKSPLRDSVLFVSVLLCTGAWYFYAHYLNSIHGGLYSVQEISPIWSMDVAEIRELLRRFFEMTYCQFFSPVTTFILFFIFIGALAVYKQIDKIYIVITLLLVIGSIAYFLLWFKVWDDHDYYMFPFFLPLVFVLIAFGDYLKKNQSGIFDSLKVKIMFSVFLLWNVWYCSNNIRMKYGIKTTEIPFMATKTEIELRKWFSWNYGNTMKAYETIEPYNRKLGIMLDDAVIAVPDPSVCITLYLMNQKGWNDYGGHIYNQDDIKNKISVGAKYLFIGDSTLIVNPVLNPYTKYKIGQYKNISVFDLRQYRE